MIVKLRRATWVVVGLFVPRNGRRCLVSFPALGEEINLDSRM